MPRRSAADAEFAVSINAGTRRLRPPDDLAAGVRSESCSWTSVASVPASHFRESDGVLLAAYCRAVCLEQTASSELAAAGHVIDGKPSGWFSILAQSVRAVTVLSSKLRLNSAFAKRRRRRPGPSSRRNPRGYYERQRLEARHDDEPTEAN